MFFSISSHLISFMVILRCFVSHVPRLKSSGSESSKPRKASDKALIAFAGNAKAVSQSISPKPLLRAVVIALPIS